MLQWHHHPAAANVTFLSPLIVALMATVLSNRKKKLSGSGNRLHSKGWKFIQAIKKMPPFTNSAAGAPIPPKKILTFAHVNLPAAGF